MYLQTIPISVRNQLGGDIRFFRGSRRVQSGGGPILNFAKGLIPIVAERIAPYIGKRLKQVKDTFQEQMSAGAPLKSALKTSVKRAWTSSKDDLMRKLKGGGAQKGGGKSKKKTKKRRVQRDFFHNH